MDKEKIAEVKRFYDGGAAQEWVRLDENREEFLLTTYMMDQYIRPGHKR